MKQKLLFLPILLLILVPLQSLAIDSIDDLSVVSHWTCDETSGVRYDSNTTNSNDLTDNNTVGYATGLRNNACDFEASNSEYLSIADGDQTGLEPSSFSISYWVNIESTYAYGFTKQHTNGVNGFSYSCGPNGDSPTIRAYMNVGTGPSTDDLTATSGTLPTATWKHIVCTYNGSTKKLIIYVDGNLKASSTGALTMTFSTGGFNLGRGATASYTDGLVDEASIFNDVLSDADVTALYNSGTPLPYTYTASSSGTSTTATSTTSFEDDNIVFALGVIIFFLTLIFTGFIFNTFRRR